MQQVQLLRPERVRSKFKAAFWGRDSITTATLLSLSGLVVGGLVVTNCLFPLLNQYLSISYLGMMAIFFIVFSLPSVLAAAITARVSPKWCLVSWATFNTIYFLMRIFPELRNMVGNGDWKQFWQLLIPYVLSFLAQTFVLLKIRRRMLSKPKKLG
jgi:hypothetical protein